MKQQFYSHLTETDALIKELDKLDLQDHEKIHLTAVVHYSMHTVILDVVLSELSPYDKKHFLHTLRGENYEEIWKFLQEKTNNIEAKIAKAAKELREEFLKDLKEAKK